MNTLINSLKSKKAFHHSQGVTIDEIISAEAALGLKFSDEYVAYLAEYGVASIYGHEFTGIGDHPRVSVLNVTLESREYSTLVPSDYYVIEEAHIDGILIWQDKSGTVFQSRPNSCPAVIASSMQEYIENN